jgi:hypothetical protein
MNQCIVAKRDNNNSDHTPYELYITDYIIVTTIGPVVESLHLYKPPPYEDQSYNTHFLFSSLLPSRKKSDGTITGICLYRFRLE